MKCILIYPSSKRSFEKATRLQQKEERILTNGSMVFFGSQSFLNIYIYYGVCGFNDNTIFTASLNSREEICCNAISIDFLSLSSTTIVWRGNGSQFISRVQYTC